MPILGLHLSDDARLLALIQTELIGTPELNKAMSLLGDLAAFQISHPTALQVTGISKRVPTIVMTRVAQIWGYEFTSSPTTAPPGWTGYSTTWVLITAVSWTGQRIGETKTVILQGNIPNSTTVLADTGLEFPVRNGQSYYFRAFIPYTSAATTTGSRWVVDGPTGQLSAYTTSTLTATTQTINYASAFNIPASANASSLLTSAAIVEGAFGATADGTIKIRFASEVPGSAITARAGSILKYERVL